MVQNIVNIVLVFAAAELMAHIGKGFWTWEHWAVVFIAIALVINNKKIMISKKRR